MRLGELEGNGHCANSEGITDTTSVILIPEMGMRDLTCLLLLQGTGTVEVEVKREAGSCEGTEKSEDEDKR